MSLIEAVRRHYCFGLIHRFTCIVIIINTNNYMYNVRMVLTTKLSYKTYIHKITEANKKGYDEKLTTNNFHFCLFCV